MIGVKALTEMMKSTRAGMYEYEVEALYEYMCKKEGVKNQAYIPIISSEENQTFLHYHKFNRLLEDGDFTENSLRDSPALSMRSRL